MTDAEVISYFSPIVDLIFYIIVVTFGVGCYYLFSKGKIPFGLKAIMAVCSALLLTVLVGRGLMVGEMPKNESLREFIIGILLTIISFIF